MGGGNHGIRIIEVVFKLITSIINKWLSGLIYLHKMLNIILYMQGTGKAIVETKLEK